MKYALYLGCTVQTEQYGYEASVRATMPRLDVELVGMVGVSCCGFPPFSSVNELAWLYSSARNIAIAEEMGLPLLTLCNGCHLSFTETIHKLGNSPELKVKVNEKLAGEGLRYDGKVKLVHIFELLHDEVGKDKITAALTNPLKGFRFAAQPGCHSIRPSRVGRPDNPENPKKLDELITWLGAEAGDYPEKNDCCGSSLAVSAGKVVLDIAGEKLKAVKRRGFDGLVTTCPFCFKVYDNKQRAIQAMGGKEIDMPVFYYTQLLGLAIGLKQEELGIDLNQSPVDELLIRIGGA
ncbi:MAG: CoB--CoM heterodisulfide reductase iron-sulfur subunit B family protein [Candidatus Bathyarchaeia archaeon]